MHPNERLIAKGMLASLLLLTALFTALIYWQLG
jgi:hypothetical protein